MNRRSTRKWFAGALLLVAFGSAQALQCLEPGKSIAYQAPGNPEFVFLDSQPDGDYEFKLPDGAYQHVSESVPGKLLFKLDDVIYEFWTIAASRFVDEGGRSDPTEILPRYADGGLQQAQKQGSPYQTPQELGRTLRPSYKSMPAIYFLRWRLGPADPKDMRGIYYLSTVAGDRIATLAANVEEPSQLALVQRRLDRFATSYRALEPDDTCPPLNKP